MTKVIGKTESGAVKAEPARELPAPNERPVMTPISRRLFVQSTAGVAAAGWVNGGAFARGGTMPRSAPPILDGPQVRLVVDQLAVNVTGRTRMATSINGSMPAPILRLREGDEVTIDVVNRLDESSSIHWHGLRLPADQDGVPGLTFKGIAPGSTFRYRFPIRQSGTYWYHGHSGMQEQTGLYGALILVPKEAEPYSYERDYVVLLSDWTDEDPMQVQSNLKQQSDYYDSHRRTVGTFLSDAKRQGWKPTVRDRLMWARMRMSPTDIMDVTGSTYSFLINGAAPEDNWTALFNPGERMRLRFINASSMSTFDVRIPGLVLSVVAADGSDIEPVSVGEFRIGVAETYDVIVQPNKDAAFTIFAQAQDRSGYARATLAPRAGMQGAVPAMDPRPLRTAADMGMGTMSGMSGMAGMDMSNMAGMSMPAAPPTSGSAINGDGVNPTSLARRIEVDNVAATAQDRLVEAGDGLEDTGRRVLNYADLKALVQRDDAGAPARELEFHLTGNMQRWVWGFDGKKFSEAGPIRLRLGERVRFVIVNDTMMEHPIHLHGFLFALENGQTDQLPLKHTVNVKPAERLSFTFVADTPGHWAFHCHLLYHMEAGMFRTVLVA